MTAPVVEEAVRELARADALAFGGVGFAGQVLPATAAYRTVADALPERAEQVRPRLTWLLAHGSPAGRAYAATLLGRFDPAAGRAAWESLVGVADEFTTYSGCLIDRTTLDAYARSRLSAASRD